jgi:hypothetical protein
MPAIRLDGSRNKTITMFRGSVTIDISNLQAISRQELVKLNVQHLT